jgi:hypothetical protein
MEGVLLVIKAWGLTALMIWVYRRFFERVARVEPEFEAWCERGPLLAALHVVPVELEQVEAALRAGLGKRRRLVATLGGWPWPNYELEIRISRAANVLLLTVARAELRKAHARPTPSLVGTLRELLNAHPGAIEDLWLLSDLVYGKLGPDEAPAGWIVLAGDEPRPRVQAREAHPAWLAALEPGSEAREAPEKSGSSAPPGPAPRSKLLSFPSGC